MGLKGYCVVELSAKMGKALDKLECAGHFSAPGSLRSKSPKVAAPRLLMLESVLMESTGVTWSLAVLLNDVADAA